MRLVSCVWRPGSGTQWVHIDLSWTDFKQRCDTYFDQGLRLVDLEVEGGKYSGVWRPGTGDQKVHHNLSWDDFRTKDLAHFDDDLRLVDLEVDDGKYAGVWRPGTGTQWVRVDMTEDEFVDQDTTYFDEGLRITDIELVGSKYAAVWRPGSGTQWVRAGRTPSEIASLDETYQGQGLRIEVLKVADGKLTAVWQPGTGDQVIQTGMSVELFAFEDGTNFDGGLRLRALEVHDKPVVIYRLPWGEDSTGWTVGQGNWDDPVHGHDQGDPNGMQAYAYDFLHSEGGKIRAARAGTVYDLDESSSTNGFNPATPCNPGVGNYLVIKHKDGTFGVYWHIRHNGIEVAVGDSVSRGDVIAHSGNTGNSSTPHLHFDARIGWDLAYSCSNLSEFRGMPVFFEDKNHDHWRPKVGDTLASDNG